MAIDTVVQRSAGLDIAKASLGKHSVLMISA
jgi:hypothetical protein